MFVQHTASGYPFREALTRFRQLKERHARGQLTSQEDLDVYESAAQDAARVLAFAQTAATRPGQSARRALRVSAAVRVFLQCGFRQEDSLTVDLGAAGFAALLGHPFAIGTSCEFCLACGGIPLHGSARVVACTQRGSSGLFCRGSFAIDQLAEDNRWRLERMILEAALGVVPG
ncbi:MAG TPA: PilZ domain-containing protein [Polyangiaceae bacterium]|jgi:hypothetical protein